MIKTLLWAAAAALALLGARVLWRRRRHVRRAVEDARDRLRDAGERIAVSARKTGRNARRRMARVVEG